MGLSGLCSSQYATINDVANVIKGNCRSLQAAHLTGREQPAIFQPIEVASAQPSPPVALVAPRSNAYQSPVGSASVGADSSNKRQRSMEWECAAPRSLSSAVLR